MRVRERSVVSSGSIDRSDEGRRQDSEFILVANGDAIPARTIRRRRVSGRCVSVWPWNRAGHRQEGAWDSGVDATPNLTKHHFLSRLLQQDRRRESAHIGQSNFDASGLTQGCSGCRAMREGIRAQGHQAVQVPATSLHELSLKNAAQDTVLSGGADGRRTSLGEGHDDEDRAKLQRTEKTDLEMEVSYVAKVKDSRRILDLRRDGREVEHINHRDAAMFCTCELQPRVILTRCTHRSQVKSTWDLCRAQGTQVLGYVGEFVANIAYNPMTKNIQVSTGCNDTIIRGSLSGPSISVISQHPPPFAESHEGNWTAEQPGHRHGAGRQP